jgi:membrane fusion protein (multidrug efflux system)
MSLRAKIKPFQYDGSKAAISAAVLRWRGVNRSDSTAMPDDTASPSTSVATQALTDSPGGVPSVAENLGEGGFRGPAGTDHDHAPAARSSQDNAPADAAKKSVANGRRRMKLLASAAALALAAAGGYGYHWWTVGRFIVSTDDAYVRANNTTLAAKVSGYVANIPIADNAPVRAGDVIAMIDDGDYRLAVDSAREKVATQQASIERFARQIAAQEAAVEQARAQLASAQAGEKRAQSEYARQQELAGKAFASQQTFEQALASRDQAVAGVQSAQASLDAALAQVDVLKAQQKEAERTLNELKTALAKAERDLAFTVIRAPVDGVFGNRAVQPGDYVQIGQRLASLVPLDDVYIDANFKETQLARLKPGQKVAISVDALPGHEIEGLVASLAPASGAVFSLLPPDNATGNFTKIVQRVPVRIRVPAEVARQQNLRPGMSVVVGVNTKSTPAQNAAGAAAATFAKAVGAARLQ